MLQTVVTCNAMQYLANKRQFVQDTDAWQTKRRFKDNGKNLTIIFKAMTFTLTLCIHQQAEKRYIYSKTLEFFNAVEGRRGIIKEL